MKRNLFVNNSETKQKGKERKKNNSMLSNDMYIGLCKPLMQRLLTECPFRKHTYNQVSNV